MIFLTVTLITNASISYIFISFLYKVINGIATKGSDWRLPTIWICLELSMSIKFNDDEVSIKTVRDAINWTLLQVNM